VLNSQYRPALGKTIWELPSGQLGNNENNEETDHRELAEESGILATDLMYLGSFYRNPSRDTGSTHIYFARVAGDTPTHQEQYEYLRTSRIPLDELIEKVLNNKIQDMATIFAVLMLQNRLSKGDIKI
jgi:ADP-ribose pyrophosphatase